MAYVLNSEKFKENENLHQHILGSKKEEKLLLDFHSNNPFAGLCFDETHREKVRREYTNEDLIDIDVKSSVIKSKNQNKHAIVSVNKALSQYSDKKVTSQTLRGLTDWFCEMFKFIYIENMALYVYKDDYLHLFSYTYALRFFTQILHEYDIDYPLRSTDCKEIVRLLQAQPQITKKQDECRTNVDCIMFLDGAFDPIRQVMCTPKLEDYQFSRIEFPLQWGNCYEASSETIDFIQRFCDYSAEMEDYLWELIGYLSSSYQQKILVVFMGPSNSGKSTLANMIRRICGSESCVALGIKELAGNFSLAELQGKRLCIDSEMDASVLNAKDISLLKKVVGNDLIQGNRKHEQQFYFECQTKFLICTNNKIKFRSDEDTISLFNRIKVFELKESIPLEEQCYDMDRILDENRTYFLQKAMEGLCRLVSNNFKFSHEEAPENFVENINRQADVANIAEFVTSCCECNEEAAEKVTDLYAAYREFALDNEKEAVSNKRFTRFLVDHYAVLAERKNRYRFYRGIKLVTGDRLFLV